jgi:hypothetical protein
MQPTEARDVGDALDDRPVPAVWPRPTGVGNEKYLGGFWIVEAFDLDVALKLATEGSKACNRKVEVRRNAANRYSRSGTAFSRPGDSDCESRDEIPSLSDRSQPV